jgi:hypothetical protein
MNMQLDQHWDQKRRGGTYTVAEDACSQDRRALKAVQQLGEGLNSVFSFNRNLGVTTATQTLMEDLHLKLIRA